MINKKSQSKVQKTKKLRGLKYHMGGLGTYLLYCAVTIPVYRFLFYEAWTAFYPAASLK